MELCAVEPELNLYDRLWPIWTYQPQHIRLQNSCLTKMVDGGEAIDSLVSAGCILSGARMKRSR